MRILPLVLLVPLTTGCLFLPLAADAPPGGSTPVAGAVTFVVTVRPTGTDVPTLEPWPTPSPMRTNEPTSRPPPTQIPTFTPRPLERPTSTLAPESTRGPANIPAPTRPPAPAATAAPIAPAPKTTFSGTGDNVVSLDKADGPALLRIVNSGARNFVVWTYDASGNKVDLLVNVIGPYRGVVLVDKDSYEPPAKRLVIKSDGAWQIDLLPLSQANRLAVPGALGGSGDDVVALAGGRPDLLKISHEGQRNFVIWSYGGGTDLLVNVIGAYSGTKPLNSSTSLLTIHADGKWSLNITAR